MYEKNANARKMPRNSENKGVQGVLRRRETAPLPRILYFTVGYMQNSLINRCAVVPLPTERKSAGRGNVRARGNAAVEWEFAVGKEIGGGEGSCREKGIVRAERKTAGGKEIGGERGNRRVSGNVPTERKAAGVRENGSEKENGGEKEIAGQKENGRGKGMCGGFA